MKIRAEMGRQRAPLLPREYQVDKVVELPNTLFTAFMDRPLDRYEFIRENMVEAHRYDGFEHCLLVLGEDRADGVLIQCGEDGLTFLCHENADRSVLAENLRELTAAGREDHDALLNARVSEIAPAPEGTEVVLTDVAPEELARFNEAYEAFMDAEQTMGPTI